jgi:hypothetical protein
MLGVPLHRSLNAFSPPQPIIAPSFGTAWLSVARQIVERRSPLRNVMVQVEDPTAFEPSFHETVVTFCRDHDLLSPKGVAYTIFPHQLYKSHPTATSLYGAYNDSGGMYDRLQRRKHAWGTYFRRMTKYGPGNVNQLDNIVRAIRRRKALATSAYHIAIAYPDSETTLKMGGPCLNYIAVQLEPRPRRLGLLCVYRNHDFLKKAYGNYWALCGLLRFLAKETSSAPGPLTCISSHAYTETPGLLKMLVGEFDEVSPATIRPA